MAGRSPKMPCPTQSLREAFQKSDSAPMDLVSWTRRTDCHNKVYFLLVVVVVCSYSPFVCGARDKLQGLPHVKHEQAPHWAYHNSNLFPNDKYFKTILHLRPTTATVCVHCSRVEALSSTMWGLRVELRSAGLVGRRHLYSLRITSPWNKFFVCLFVFNEF